MFFTVIMVMSLSRRLLKAWQAVPPCLEVKSPSPSLRGLTVVGDCICATGWCKPYNPKFMCNDLWAVGHLCSCVMCVVLVWGIFCCVHSSWLLLCVVLVLLKSSVVLVRCVVFLETFYCCPSVVLDFLWRLFVSVQCPLSPTGLVVISDCV